MSAILSHGVFVADAVRVGAYDQALRQVVRPDSVVLDIGTGSGILALLACRAGARRVYAVEPDDVIALARQFAAANGCAERVEFIQALSTQAVLPEPADVIVSDLRGILPLHSQHLPIILDARRRFLARGGVLIPQADTLWAAVVEAPESYRRHVAPWEGRPGGLDLAAGRTLAVNAWSRDRVQREQLLTAPHCWARLEYATLETPNVAGETTWTAERAGTAHGVCIWFDASLAAGVTFSNAPGEPELLYGQAFFPWPAPVPVVHGDTIQAAFQAHLEGAEYTWQWVARVQGQTEQVKADFKQSTLAGQAVSLVRLRRRGDRYRPTRNEEGQVDRLILEQMDGMATLRDIAGRIAEQFPARFADQEEALAHVRDIAEEYGR